MKILIIGDYNTGKTEYAHKLKSKYLNKLIIDDYSYVINYDVYIFEIPGFTENIVIHVNNVVESDLTYDAAIIMTKYKYYEYYYESIKEHYRDIPIMILFNHCDKLEVVEDFLEFCMENPEKYIKCCCAIKDINVDSSLIGFLNIITHKDL